MRIEVDLKNLNYRVITNEGAKCGFCNKDLKPIGFDYLYVNYDKNMIEYERCNCEKAIQFWKEFDLEQEEKQRQEKYRKIINSIYKDNYMKKRLQKYSFRNGKDPWEAMDEIGMSDYYKYPASACLFDQYFYCSAFGKDFEVWNFIVNMDAEHKGIRWKSVPDSSKPLWAVAADTQHLFYYCSETELEDGDSSEDPMIRTVSRYMDQNGIPKNNPIIFKEHIIYAF